MIRQVDPDNPDMFWPRHVTLQWSDDHPDVVGLQSLSHPSRDVVWMLPRQVLADGLYNPAQASDIYVFPDLDQPTWRELTLVGASTSATFRISTATLAHFLRRTGIPTPGVPGLPD